MGFGSDHSVHQRLSGHFKAEDAHRHAALASHIAGDVQSQGGLAYGRSGRQDDKVGFLESGQQVVQFGESAGHAP